jgi:hypothetical protein
MIEPNMIATLSIHFNIFWSPQLPAFGALCTLCCEFVYPEYESPKLVASGNVNYMMCKKSFIAVKSNSYQWWTN